MSCSGRYSWVRCAVCFNAMAQVSPAQHKEGFVGEQNRGGGIYRMRPLTATLGSVMPVTDSGLVSP